MGILWLEKLANGQLREKNWCTDKEKQGAEGWVTYAAGPKKHSFERETVEKRKRYPRKTRENAI